MNALQLVCHIYYITSMEINIDRLRYESPHVGTQSGDEDPGLFSMPRASFLCFCYPKRITRSLQTVLWTMPTSYILKSSGSRPSATVLHCNTASRCVSGALSHARYGRRSSRPFKGDDQGTKILKRVLMFRRKVSRDMEPLKETSMVYLR